MPCLRKAYPPDCARAETGGLTMAEYASLRKIEFELCGGNLPGKYKAFVRRVLNDRNLIHTANVAPIEALERLRDEMCAQDLITMEGLRKLNTLIWKYTTVHDGGAE